MLTRPRDAVRRLWHGPGGGREVLALAYPLILAHMSFTVQTFVDRLFLTWYSAEAVAGAGARAFPALAVVAPLSRPGGELATVLPQAPRGPGPPRLAAPAGRGCTAHRPTP